MTSILTGSLSWHEALTATDTEQSRRAFSEYVAHADRPPLSVDQLVDALLRWSTDHEPVPADLAMPVFAATFDRPALELDDPIEAQIVSYLAKQVLGWTLTLPAKPTTTGHSVQERILSRAAAAGIQELLTAAQLSPVTTARKACVALNSCRYVRAAQGLTILCALDVPNVRTPAPEALTRFIAQGHAHLTALAAVHRSTSLAWELRLLDTTREQTRTRQW